MQKAERMKNKMSGGKKLVTIDNIMIRFLQQQKIKNNKKTTTIDNIQIRFLQQNKKHKQNNNKRQHPAQVFKELGIPQHLTIIIIIII